MYSHQQFTDFNTGEQTVVLYRGLSVFAIFIEVLNFRNNTLKVWNEVLEKNREYDLDQSCNKMKKFYLVTRRKGISNLQ